MNENYPYLKDLPFLKSLIIQPIQSIYVRFTSLDWNENPLCEIQGLVTSGSMNLNGQSSIRRTCNLTIAIPDEVDYQINSQYTIKQLIGVDNKINLIFGNAVEILPTLKEKYDIIFIDAAKSKYEIFLEEGIRLSKSGSIILADNILYKGYVMSDYNKHKQRTAVRHLREYIKLVTENPNLKTEILEVGDGLAISKVILPTLA